jgi:hypothetical protein
MLSGVCRVLQSAVLDCLPLDPFSFEDDGVAASEVDVGRAVSREDK